MIRDVPELIETLPVLQRLALSYAPKASKIQTLTLLALDARLAEVVRSASEPIMAQLRLAWWRDMFAKPAQEWPEREPLLANLKVWEGEVTALSGLVDGWEAMTAQAPLPISAMQDLANARGETFGALACLLNESSDSEQAARAGRNWAVADIASRLTHPEERAAAAGLANTLEWKRAKLSRKLRPLVVLHGLAARSHSRGERLDELSATAILPIMRLGLLGT